MAKRVIRLYEKFEGGSSLTEPYELIDTYEQSEQLCEELSEISDLEEMLKGKGVSHFKLCFDENYIANNLNNKEGNKNDI